MQMLTSETSYKQLRPSSRSPRPIFLYLQTRKVAEAVEVGQPN